MIDIIKHCCDLCAIQLDLASNSGWEWEARPDRAAQRSRRGTM